MKIEKILKNKILQDINLQIEGTKDWNDLKVYYKEWWDGHIDVLKIILFELVEKIL